MKKSISSPFGKLSSKLFDEYPIYKCEISSELINNYLPDVLHSFASTSLTNILKRDFFYSKPILFASSIQLTDHYEQLSNSMKLEDLFKELLSKSNNLIRYNFVITGKELILVRIARTYHISYHLHSKHIVLSNHSNDLRFAGELWTDENKIFRLNNNSGTYCPSNILIEKSIELLNQLIPNLTFKGISFHLSSRPSFKDRFLFQIRERNLSKDLLFSIHDQRRIK